MKQWLIIGLGTGRCGTRSFTKLLDAHPDIAAVHESCGFNWWQDTEAPIKAIEFLRCHRSESIISDVAYYWLDYVDRLLNEYPDTKFVCLKRDRDAVVRSFMRVGSFALHHRILEKAFEKKIYRLCDHVTQNELDNMDKGTRDWVDNNWDVPVVYEIAENSPEGRKKRREWFKYYWTEYYKTSEKWQEKYPDNFIIIDMNEALNTEEGKSKIFNFIGIVPDAAIQ